MSALTKDELRAILLNHGVDLPASSAKKEELVALYEQFVMPLEKSKGEFSSDDEEVVIKKVSRSSRKSASSEQAFLPDQVQESVLLTEDNSLSVGGIDIQNLDDSQLIEMLKNYGVEVGPVVDSTRVFYRKKLAILMRESTAANDKPFKNGKEEAVEHANGYHVQVNGDEPTGGEFSADNETEDDDPQPSLLVKKSSGPKQSSVNSKDNTSCSSLTSPLQNISFSLRQRFGGSSDQADVSRVAARFTPTPRRSIHSYKVTTETAKQTTVKSKDGTISHDFDYRKQVTDSKIGGPTRRLVQFMPGIFLLLMLIGLFGYIYKQQALIAQAVLDAVASSSAFLSSPNADQGDQASLTNEI